MPKTITTTIEIIQTIYHENCQDGPGKLLKKSYTIMQFFIKEKFSTKIHNFCAKYAKNNTRYDSQKKLQNL